MSDAVPVLRLFEAILGAPSGETARIRIVPVIADDISTNERVMREIVERSGGTYLRAVDSADGADGELDPALVRLVGEARIARSGAADLVPSVVAPVPGRVRTELTGLETEEGDENPGFKQFRGVLTSLFSNNLRQYALVVLAYDETEMDPDVAHAARLLVCRQLEHQLLGAVRTLVVLIRARQIDYDEHCSGITCSARYHLTETACRTRNALADSRVRIGVAADAHDDPTVLFLGAGFSRSSGVPLAETLRNDAIRRLLRTDAKPDALAELFRQYLATFERFLDGEDDSRADDFAASLTLERVLREEFNHYGMEQSPTLAALADANTSAVATPGLAVRELKRIVDFSRRVVVATVNQDTLIETACGAAVKVFVTESDFRSWDDYLRHYIAEGGAVPVLKLHGSIERRETVIASVDLTLRGLPDHLRAALSRLATPRRPRWSYVGYSMRDLDLLGLLSEADFGSQVDESWVAPFPEPNARRFAGHHRATIWRKTDAADFNARMITETADVFMHEFASAWCT
jgi:SIR2-like protein